MKYTTTGNHPFTIFLTLTHTQSKVLIQFLHQTVVNVTRSHKLTITAEERRIINGEQHTHSRFVNSDRWQCFRVFKVADRITDFKAFDTYQRTDVTGRNFRYLRTSHTFKCMQFLDFGFHKTSITLGQRYIHTLSKRTTMYTTYGNTSGIRRIIQRSYKHLRSTFQLRGSRYILYNTVQQCEDIISRSLPVRTHPVVLCRTVDNGEIQLILCSIQTEHQVEHHFIYLFRTTVRFVYLVHYNNGFQTNLQSFLQHETCLGHRTFESIHQQDTSVRHIQHTFHLTSEVAVSRSINDIDFCSFVIDRNVFRKDRYPSLTFQVVVIQH